MVIIINKYITDTINPAITASPPSLGMAVVFTLLSSFGLSTAPIFFAYRIVCGVITKAVIKASRKAIAISPHIASSFSLLFSSLLVFYMLSL